MDAAMLAQTVDPADLPNLIKDDAWVIEQKLDGKRLIVEVEAQEARAYNRHGEPASLPLPVAAAFDHPGFSERWVFDGELVGDTYYVFDVLAMPNRGEATWARATFGTRRMLLESLFGKFTPPTVVLVPQATTTQEKADLLGALEEHNKEGAIFKRLHAPHQPGKRSYDFLKHKFTQTADVVVTETRAGGKPQAVRTALYHDGMQVDAGGCKIPEEMIDRLSVGDVIECRYLYGTSDHKLYQPAWVGLRDDKRPEECTTDQLKHTSREVLL